MLLEEGLAKETSKNKAKDARQKTSPLVDLGLVDNILRNIINNLFFLYF
ncbi:hypothetical protein [Lebetimonas sp. JH292]|nr:hypothetical protein [Lebetimonas sp. JH292]